MAPGRGMALASAPNRARLSSPENLGRPRAVCSDSNSGDLYSAASLRPDAPRWIERAPRLDAPWWIERARDGRQKRWTECARDGHQRPNRGDACQEQQL